MATKTRARLLQLSKETALYITVGGFLLTIVVITVAMLAFGLDERSGPIVAALFVALGGQLPSLIGALKAIESADRTAKVQNVQAQHSLDSNGGFYCPDPSAHTKDVAP